jgi:hypothetical protein
MPGRTRLAALAMAVGASLAGGPAAAQDQVRGRPTIGLRGSWLGALQVSGGIGPDHASAQSPTIALQLYADWQLSDLVAIGCGVPATLNAPGPSSNAYDVGVAPRIRVGRLLRAGIHPVYPYLVAAPGIAWSRLPQSVWLPGFTFTAGSGASVKLSGPLSFLVELGYQYTSFSGNAPLYRDATGTAPVLHAAASVSALALGAGFEVRL